MKFHHIGFACKDLESTRKWVKSTHVIVEETGPVFDPLEKASFYTLKTHDGILIELIAGDPVVNILKKGISLYQVCYEVLDLDEAIRDFRAKGAIVVSPPKPSTLFCGRRIAFLHTPIGIIELVEEKIREDKT